ncbi:MAG: hypothetical protein CVU05_10610 [Bacteroidetes bacterium HGW-Bacteroidetes-21]|jgi:hypothetical protein|nr:MAG: hypothetical protein CVU05_10610 [Bacteroidetes bacterium HGW-Bacteroidetes-21]
MFFKNIKNKELRRLIIVVILIVVYISSALTYIYIKRYFLFKDVICINLTDSVHGVIKKVFPCEENYENCSPTASFILNTGKRYAIFTENYPNYRNNIQHQISVGDEIFKASNSETIFVVKDNRDTLLFLLEKPASYYDTIMIQPFGEKLSIKQNN